jgi:hypothetical protein
MNKKDIDEARALFDRITPIVTECYNPDAIMYALSQILGSLLAQINNADEVFNDLCESIKIARKHTEIKLRDTKES